MILPFLRKGFGYKRDRRDDRDRPFGFSPSDALDIPSDLRGNVRRVYNQLRTNTCVTNAAISARSIRRVQLGLDWEDLSRLYPYWYGRTRRQRLVDGGSYPRLVLKALSKLGAPPETDWPFDTKKVNRRPPSQLHRIAVDRDFEYLRCWSNSDVAMALSEGCPVVIGMPVDRAFVQSDGPEVVTDIGRPIGNHMMVIVANDPNLRAFCLLNSYGRGYRMGGFVWVDHEVIAEKGQDKWAIR